MSKEGIAVVQIMRHIRNNAIHAPYKLHPITSVLAVFYSKLTPNAIHDLTWFYTNNERICSFLESISSVTRDYTNIEKYKQRFNMTDEMFNADVPRLMSVLNVQTTEELNEHIVELL